MPFTQRIILSLDVSSDPKKASGCFPAYSTHLDAHVWQSEAFYTFMFILLFNNPLTHLSLKIILNKTHSHTHTCAHSYCVYIFIINSWVHFDAFKNLIIITNLAVHSCFFGWAQHRTEWGFWAVHWHDADQSVYVQYIALPGSSAPAATMCNVTRQNTKSSSEWRIWVRLLPIMKC